VAWAVFMKGTWIRFGLGFKRNWIMLRFGGRRNTGPLNRVAGRGWLCIGRLQMRTGKNCRCMWKGNKRVSVCPQCPALVMIESPLASPLAEGVTRNLEYARDCLRDSLRRGEAPLASHLLYPQVLDDTISAQRDQGIEAGLAWGRVADLSAVYTDLGITPGMQKGIDRAKEQGRRIEYRQIRNNPPHFQDRD
jgi:hypothetical protein